MLNKLSFRSRSTPSSSIPISPGTRLPLTSAIVAQLKAQFAGMQERPLQEYRFEKQRSSQTGAREDFTVYDEAGVIRFLGRTFDSKTVFFWRP